MNGATPNGTPLRGACFGGHADVISVLLAKGANVEAIHPSTGETPVQLACDRGHVEAVKALLRGGAHVSASDVGFIASGNHFLALGALVLQRACEADSAALKDIQLALASLTSSAH